MSTAIQIGCRLPAGYTLEVGLQTVIVDPTTRRPVTQVQRRDDYQRVTLRGTHAHTAKMRAQKIQVPSMLNPEPAFTTVPVEFWERWKKEHPKAAVLKQGDVFEVKNENDRKAIVLDAMAKPAPLAPVDPDKIYRTDGNKVEKAVFDEDK